MGLWFWALACVLVCDRGRERKGERDEPLILAAVVNALVQEMLQFFPAASSLA